MFSHRPHESDSPDIPQRFLTATMAFERGLPSIDDVQHTLVALRSVLELNRSNVKIGDALAGIKAELLIQLIRAYRNSGLDSFEAEFQALSFGKTL